MVFCICNISTWSIHQYIHLVGPKVENTPEGGVTVAPVCVSVVSKIIESLKDVLAMTKMVLVVMIAMPWKKSNMLRNGLVFFQPDSFHGQARYPWFLHLRTHYELHPWHLGSSTLEFGGFRPGHMLRPAENFIREMKELSNRAGLHWDNNKNDRPGDDGTLRSV